MMKKEAKIYVAGHRGLVGSALVRRLEKDGFTNIITRTHGELDLTRQADVEAFFAQEKPDYVILAAAKVGGINANNTAHSDGILSEDKAEIRKFEKGVDAACVYVNASTRFTDGFQFGFGAEIGISTQKLHARGPLGLEQLTSEKYIAEGDYLSRK